MVDMHLRKDVLYVWCSFTMIFNLAYFFIDTTGIIHLWIVNTQILSFKLDHQAAERKEKAKEEKRQKKEKERQKRREEKRREKLKRMMSPRARFLVNTLVSYSFSFFIHDAAY